MLVSMYIEEFYIVYPEGDIQEISARLSLNQIVDINGGPLPLPLINNRIIAFRVIKVRKKEDRGSSQTYHYLELIKARELLEYCE